jgi:hypothetical protein
MTARDEAAISDLIGPALMIGSRPVHQAWRIPRSVKLRDGCLEWNPSGRYKQVAPDGQLLERFLGLYSAPDAAILQFARRYGTLRICPHGLPSSHDRDCYPAGWHEGVCRESLEDWRFYSAQALALLKVAAALTRGQLPAAADWQTVYQRSGRKAPWWTRDVEGERLGVEDVLQEMLSHGSPRLTAVWNPGCRPALEIAPGGLYGAIAIQVCLRAAQSDGLARCDSCACWFTPPQRKPKAGQRTFCPDCRASGAPARFARRDYLERKRENAETCE